MNPNPDRLIQLELTLDDLCWLRGFLGGGNPRR